MRTAKQRARTAANIIKKQFNEVKFKSPGRKFDALFEQGDGEKVVVAFINIYLQDTELKKAVSFLNHFIGVEHWIKTHQEQQLF